MDFTYREIRSLIPNFWIRKISIIQSISVPSPQFSPIHKVDQPPNKYITYILEI